MAHNSVDLPDDLMTWVERQVTEGRYDSLDAYVADLVARDMDDAGKLAASNAAIEEGLSAEPADDSMADATARPDRDDDALGALRRSWTQGIGSGSPVDGNFNAADIARRGSRSGEAVRKHG